MRDDLIEASVVLDLAQVAVIVDRQQRVRLERFESETVLRLPKGFRLKSPHVVLEQHVENPEECGLADAAASVEHEEFLNLLAVSRKD